MNAPRLVLSVIILSAALTIVCSPASATEQATPESKAIAWILPDGGTASDVTWPQPIASDTNLAAVPCDTTVTLQVDTYPYATVEDQTRTDALAADGILTQGEDYGWVMSWKYETFTAPACAPEPEPVASVEPSPSPEPSAPPADVTIALTEGVDEALAKDDTPVLALTGPTDDRTITLGIGLLIACVGLALMAARSGIRHRRATRKDVTETSEAAS